VAPQNARVGQAEYSQVQPASARRRNRQNKQVGELRQDLPSAQRPDSKQPEEGYSSPNGGPASYGERTGATHRDGASGNNRIADVPEMVVIGLARSEGSRGFQACCSDHPGSGRHSPDENRMRQVRVRPRMQVSIGMRGSVAAGATVAALISIRSRRLRIFTAPFRSHTPRSFI